MAHSLVVNKTQIVRMFCLEMGKVRHDLLQLIGDLAKQQQLRCQRLQGCGDVVVKDLPVTGFQGFGAMAEH